MKGLTNEAYTGSTNGNLNKFQSETPPPTYTTELHILPKVNASHVSIVYNSKNKKIQFISIIKRNFIIIRSFRLPKSKKSLNLRKGNVMPGAMISNSLCHALHFPLVWVTYGAFRSQR